MEGKRDVAMCAGAIRRALSYEPQTYRPGFWEMSSRHASWMLFGKVHEDFRMYQKNRRYVCGGRRKVGLWLAILGWGFG